MFQSDLEFVFDNQYRTDSDSKCKSALKSKRKEFDLEFWIVCASSKVIRTSEYLIFRL